MDSFNIFDPDRRELSGPTNALRLEGTIEGTSKVVYLFLNVGTNIDLQTECANVHSQDFIKYLVDTFHNLSSSNRMYDFFYEARGSLFKVNKRTRRKAALALDPLHNRGGTRRAYLDRILPLIRSITEYDKDRDRFGVSEVFKNVRLHYFDINEILDEAVISPLLALPVSLCINAFDIPQQVFDDLGRVRRLINQYLRIYEMLETDPESSQLPVDNPVVKRLRKLMYSYRHSSIQKVIRDRLDHYMQEFKNLDSNITTSLEVFKQHALTLGQRGVVYNRDNQIDAKPVLRIRLEIFSDTHNRLNSMRELAQYIVIGITDCYLLRRFADKDYIQNAIIYARGSHIINYVSTLMGPCQFKLSHISKPGPFTIPELNKTISERLSTGHSITDLLFQPEYLQCVDVTAFPKDFL